MDEKKETGCCPRFDPERWDGKEVTWDEKLFVRDRVKSLFHVPLNFGGVMKRVMTAVESSQACDPDPIVLSDENSLWGADVYVAVKKPVPGQRCERLSGTFFTKVFEGPYSRARSWCKEMNALLEKRGQPARKLYYWYTTCPKCAKAYGKNYVVMLAQVGAGARAPEPATAGASAS